MKTVTLIKINSSIQSTSNSSLVNFRSQALLIIQPHRLQEDPSQFQCVFSSSLTFALMLNSKWQPISKWINSNRIATSSHSLTESACTIIKCYPTCRQHKVAIKIWVSSSPIWTSELILLSSSTASYNQHHFLILISQSYGRRIHWAKQQIMFIRVLLIQLVDWTRTWRSQRILSLRVSLKSSLHLVDQRQQSKTLST